MYRTPQEYYFPLADSCALKGDPAEGCLYSGSSFYATYSQKALNCWDAASCNTTCASRDGKWDYVRGECVVTFFLTKVCYRVTSVNDSFVIDHTS